MKLGAHVSISHGFPGAIDETLAIGGEVYQIYSRNPKAWIANDITDEEKHNFAAKVKETGIKIGMIHANYLINLASPDEEQRVKSHTSLQKELERASALNIPYLNVHVGKAKDTSIESALDRAVEMINTIHIPDNVWLVLENGAGQGSEVGTKFTEIAYIIANCKQKKRMGICLDTCHSFVAGYDLREKAVWEQIIEEIDEVGIDHLKFFHINDAKKGLGSRVDRHEWIGKGEMGLEPFRILVNHPVLSKIPGVLETAKEGPEDDIHNLKVLRGLMKQK